MAGPLFSSALDEPYTYSAIRYVEKNPVEAGMVTKAEEYPWSSAAHHCGLAANDVLSNRANSVVGISESDWSDWLATAENKAVTEILERNVEKGLPCGKDSFIDRLEQLTNSSLRYRPQGRPMKK